MHCIDSDCIIDFLRGKPEAMAIVEKHKDDIVTTEINVFEVFTGIYRRKPSEEEIARSFFSNIEILGNYGWGLIAAQLLSNLQNQGKEIQQNDCLIAAVMKATGCHSIITRNTNHFSRIQGIDVIPY